MEEEREEGELSESESNTCDDVNVYNPVVRPTSNICRPRNTVPTVSSSENESSSSDSDSDFMSVPKRPKYQSTSMEVERNGSQNSALIDASRKKKNNIWANVIQEEELTLEIGGVGLKKLKGDRNVESYDYEQALKLHKTEDAFEESIEETEENIRKRQMRKRRFYEHLGNPKTEKPRGKPRKLVDITLNPDWDNRELGCAIADALFEQKPELIVKVVDVLGQEKALELYTMAQETEKEGGMMIFNGSRRRTSGGVYLQLLKSLEGVEKSHLAQIFCEDTKETQQWRKRKRMNRKRDKQKIGGAENTEEADLPSKGLFTDDPGGTKCPGSTPVTSPTASDIEEDPASPNSKMRDSCHLALPFKEACEKVASEIQLLSQGREETLTESLMETC